MPRVLTRLPRLRRHASGLIAALLPVVVVLAPGRWCFRAPATAQDEATLLVYPALIVHGAVPNKSFESVYGPNNLWALAAAYGLGGHAVDVERATGLVYRLVLVLALYVLLRPAGRWRAALGASVAALVETSALGYVATAWIGALALSVVGLLCLLRSSRTSIVGPALAGLAFGLALGTRPDLAAAVALGCAAAFRRRRPAAYAAFAGAVVVGLLPMLVNIAQAGVAAVIRGEFVEPIFVFPAGRKLPLTYAGVNTLIVAIAAVLVVVAVLWTWWRGRTALAGTAEPGSADAGIQEIRLTVALFSLGLIPYYLSRADTAHMLLAFGVPLGAVALLLGDRPLPTRVHQVAAAVVAGFALVATAVLIGGTYVGHVTGSLLNSLKPYAAVRHDGRSLPMLTRQSASRLSAVLDEVDRLVADGHGRRLVVAPDDMSKAPYTDTRIYFLLPHLVPGTFFLESEPGVANVGTRLAHDVRRADIVVTSTGYLYWTEPNHVEASKSQRANKVLARQFVRVFEIGPWRVYVRRTQGPVLPSGHDVYARS